MSSMKKILKAGRGAKARYLDMEDAEAMTGSRHPAAIIRRLNQLQHSLGSLLDCSPEEKQARIQAAMETLQGIAPEDDIEGMLAVQMIATHDMAIDCLRLASSQLWDEPGRDMSIKHALKLMAHYNDQVKLLDRRRGRGQQKITVEHVNVHSGGQAIVGNVGI